MAFKKETSTGFSFSSGVYRSTVNWAVHVISSGHHVASFSVPQMVRTGNDLVLAWTDQADGVNRVMSARISIDSLH